MKNMIEATALDAKQTFENIDEMNIEMGVSDVRIDHMTADTYRPDGPGGKLRNLVMTMVMLTLVLLTGLPGQADAATVNYYVTPGAVTNVAGAPTAHTSCADPTSSYGDLLTTSIGNMCTVAYRWTQGSPGLHSKAYFNTAYTVDTTVTGTSYQVTMRDGGQVGFQLFYVNAAGNETLFGNEVTIQQADGVTNNYVVDLSAQSAVVPAGSKLGLRTWGYNADPSFRMYLGNPDSRTGNISGHLIVDEAAGGGGDTTAPTVTAFTLPATSASPIAVTSFTASDDTSVTGYMITESASAPAAGAAGWTGSAPTTITTASIGSVTFYAWAKDAAGNVSASQNATVNVTTGGGGGGSFDQTDDFSTGWGNWVNVTGDQQDWTRQTGITASSNTGPTANSGADQGGDGWYVYTETSSPTVAGDQYYLESNDLDAGTYNLNISFYWNMYGADMGSLHLDVWNGSSWDLDIWSRSGNNGDAWVQQVIDLAAAGYTSGTIKLRFRGIKGSNWASDMALDTIRIYGDAAGGPDSLVVTSNAPLANSAVEGSTDVPMQRLEVDCTAGGADDGICEITGITVDDLGTVTGTEIDNLKIYIDTDTAFSGSEPSVTDASFAGASKAIDLTSIASGTRQVTAGTPKYIWVTYDLAFGSVPAEVQSSVTAVTVNAGSGDTGATGTWNSNNFAITATGGMNCASCHAYPPADGTRGVNGAVVGDHQTPAHLAATCDVCHVVPATETSADAGHRNGYIQMKDGTIGDAASGDNGSYSKGATFAQSNNPTTGTCSNVDCHNNMVTPQWGVGTLDHTVALGAGDLSNGISCSACHDDNSGGLASWTDIYVEHLSDCATCHNSARSEVITAISTGADPTNCLDCHSDKTVAHGSVDHVATNLVTLTSPCNDCHDPGTAANATVDITHSGNCSLCHTTVPNLQPGVPVGGGTCATCHTGDVQTAHASCSTCHGEPPNGSSSPNTTGAHDAHAPLGFGSVSPSCNACHDGASHYNGSTDVGILSSFDDLSSGSPSFNGSTCSNTSCHGGQTTPTWSTGSLDVNTQCSSCHQQGTTEYNSFNSGEHNRHVSRSIACTECHNTSVLATGHFTNLQTTSFEQDPASTIGGTSSRPNMTYNGTSCSNIGCHGSEIW